MGDDIEMIDNDLYLSWSQKKPDFGDLKGNSKNQLGCRDLFYHLVNKLETNSHVLFEAYNFIQYKLNITPRNPPKSTDNFNFLLHRKDEFEKRVTHLCNENKTRVAAIQFAPSGLYRGSWLQQVCRIPFSDTPVGSSFLNILRNYIGVYQSNQHG